MKHMFVPGLIWMMDRWTWFIWFKLDRIWGLGRTNGRMTEQFEYFWPAFRHFFFDIDMDWHDLDNFKMVTSSLVTNSKSMILSKIGYTLNSLVNHNLPVFLAVLSVFSISRRAHIPSYPIISHHIPSYHPIMSIISHIVSLRIPYCWWVSPMKYPGYLQVLGFITFPSHSPHPHWGKGRCARGEPAAPEARLR